MEAFNIIKAYEASGLRLVDGVYPAKTRIAKHAHQEAVFCVGLAGSCREIFAGKTRQYEASTVQYLPAGQCHSLDFPWGDTRAFNLHIDQSWIERALEFSLRLDDSIHSHGGLLTGLMMKIYEEVRCPDGATPVSIQGLAMEMLAAVSRHRPNRPDRHPQPWLVRVVDLLRGSFTENVTLSQMASEAGVHPVYLAREFRRFHGCTMGEYIRRHRVQFAARQLTASDEPLASIAAEAGFSDQSHFSRTFKRYIGMTPSQYRSTFDNSGTTSGQECHIRWITI